MRKNRKNKVAFIFVGNEKRAYDPEFVYGMLHSIHICSVQCTEHYLHGVLLERSY